MITLEEYIDRLDTTERAITQLIHDAVDLDRTGTPARSTNEVIDLTRIRHQVQVIRRHAEIDNGVVAIESSVATDVNNLIF